MSTVAASSYISGDNSNSMPNKRFDPDTSPTESAGLKRKKTAVSSSANSDEANLEEQKNEFFALAVPLYEQCARDGNVYAQRELARAYLRGLVPNSKPADCIAWYEMLAKEGSDGSDADRFALAEIYAGEEWPDIDTNMERARALYEQLAERGHAGAMYKLAVMLDEEFEHAGIDDKDTERAFGWYLRAAEAGHPEAAHSVAVMCQSGLADTLFGKKDYRSALRWYKVAAERGVVEAMTSAADMLERGRGTLRKKRDLPAAIELYTRAIAKGDVQARRALFRLYGCKPTSGERERRRLHHLEISADTGDPRSQCDLADAYESGSYTLRADEKIAFEWYKRAAENNHQRAFFKLSVYYAKGRGGVERNERLAFYWCERAVRENYPYFNCKLKLAKFYARGFGVRKDYARAEKWYRAHISDAPDCVSIGKAKMRLAELYESGGPGLEQNLPKAFDLYEQVVANGLPIGRVAEAKFRMGAILVKEEGASADLERGVRLLKEAQEAGVAEAGAMLDKLDLEVCPICLDEMIFHHSMELACGHRLHFKCLREAIQKGISCCPMCRHPF